ncbi:MAG: hypothetical protein LCH95_05780 [Proteobacteria bacterium]|nr:hypothetical protein [Pseudomonadota bacterium]
MSTKRSLLSRLAVLAGLAAAVGLAACQKNPDPEAPTGPAVPMPGIQSAIDNATPETARNGMANKTWLWVPAGGPAQIHYSTADGRDFAWVVGQRRIFAGEWRVASDHNNRGREIVSICLRHPGGGGVGLSEAWHCTQAGKLFYETAQREAGDPLRIDGRSEALFVLDKTPASLAEVQARVRN